MGLKLVIEYVFLLELGDLALLSHFEDILDYSILRYQSKGSVLNRRVQVPTVTLKNNFKKNTFFLIHGDTQHSHSSNRISRISMVWSYSLRGDIRIPSNRDTYCNLFDWDIHLGN